MYYEGEVTRAGNKIALGGGVTAASTPSARIRLFSANGPYPAKPTARCNLNDPTDAFQDLSWSPDGSALAFEDPEGIWVMPVNLDDCSSLRPTLAVPGGQDGLGPRRGGGASRSGGQPPARRRGGGGCGAGGRRGAKAERARGQPHSFRARRGALIRFRLSAAATVTLRVRPAGRRHAVRGALTRRGTRARPHALPRPRRRAAAGARPLSPDRGGPGGRKPVAGRPHHFRVLR